MRGFGWLGCALVLLLGASVRASAQERPPPKVDLHENYPNPFFPSTTIPFVLNPELCEKNHQPLVSLKIYNVLVQVVAVPVLLNSNGERLDGLRHSDGPGAHGHGVGCRGRRGRGHGRGLPGAAGRGAGTDRLGAGLRDRRRCACRRRAAMPR